MYDFFSSPFYPHTVIKDDNLQSNYLFSLQVLRLLQDFGIEKIDTVTVLSDPNNADVNRGFAYLELETNRDAQIAYKKLQNKEAFGVGKNVKVAWSKQLDDVDDEDKQKVHP